MRLAVLGFVVFAGISAVLVCAFYLLQDWALLRAHYAQFEQAASSGADMRTLFIAEAKQNVFRINVFAEGVWMLLGALLAAVGLHGIFRDAAKPPQRIILGTLPSERPSADASKLADCYRPAARHG